MVGRKLKKNEKKNNLSKTKWKVLLCFKQLKRKQTKKNDYILVHPHKYQREKYTKEDDEEKL